jgi:hypothetical protein
VAEAPPVRVIGTLTGSTIVGNVFDGASGSVFAEAIGEQNYLERRSVGANQHELTAATDGAVVVRATAAPAVDSQAYGSFVAASEQATGAGPGVKGGVRVVPTDESGAAAVELLASTDEANGVVAMSADAAGVHTTTLHLATVAPGELPEPTPGAVVFVTDPAGRATLAVSDGQGWRQLLPGAQIR